MTSLTREDARERAEVLAVDSYDVNLDLNLDGSGGRYFGSVSTIRFNCAAAGESTFVDIAAHEIRSATLNGRSIDPASAFSPVTRRLTLSDLAEQNELSVDAVMKYSHDGEGLHRSVDPADGQAYLYAMSFLDAAPRWFACFDQPDLKAPVTIDVRCPADWHVAGNGPAQQHDAGRWTISSAGPLGTYFTTLVAGPYHAVRDEHDGIPLVLHVRQSLAAQLERDAEHLLSQTRHCLDELHALFHYRYPWGEYHQAFVPDFNAGAMENPGCVTLRDTMIFRSRATDAELLNRDITIAHEMAHMWFGDLVTMRWWDDLWLNESFAEYLGQRITGPHAWTQFGAERKSWGYAADRRPSTHPVAGNGAPDAQTALTDFDGISYAKGASVLRQLSVHLGDAVFLAGLRRYIAAHAWRNAEFADLVNAWTVAGATGLERWTGAWLRTSGMDELAAEGGELIRREPPDRPGRTHTVAVAELDTDGAERARHVVRVSAERTPLQLGPAALVLPDAGDETWAKVRLDADAWAAMPVTLAVLPDPRARVVVWNALQLAVEDAEVAPSTAADVVVGALPTERTTSTLARVGRWALRRLCGTLLTEADRAGTLARICGAALAVTQVAEPGSGRQLAAFRIAVASTIDTARLRGWLAGDGQFSGLEIDRELRWAVLLRLAELGEAGEEEIAQELAADRSSQGAVHAARCSAARPDPEAKQLAWAALMTDPDRPNYELYALADGFWDPDQAELTDGYVARYFEQIPATTQLRSGWVVDELARRAYPWAAVHPETLDASERLLAAPDLPAGLRRSVVDAADDLRRALQVRRAAG